MAAPLGYDPGLRGGALSITRTAYTHAVPAYVATTRRVLRGGFVFKTATTDISNPYERAKLDNPGLADRERKEHEQWLADKPKRDAAEAEMKRINADAYALKARLDAADDAAYAAAEAPTAWDIRTEPAAAGVNAFTDAVGMLPIPGIDTAINAGYTVGNAVANLFGAKPGKKYARDPNKYIVLNGKVYNRHTGAYVTGGSLFKPGLARSMWNGKLRGGGLPYSGHKRPRVIARVETLNGE